jgi:glycosyltransferase involved in cell wall biosynthesis
VLLTNFIPPYRVPLLRALSRRTGALTTLLSTAMEGNRAWPANWAGLDVMVQRGVSVRRQWRHPSGFSEQAYLHVPYDTIPLLRRLRPEVVIAAEMGPRTAQAALYCRLTRTPLVVWATLSEETEKGRGLARRIVRTLLLRQAHAVLVNGRSGQRYVRGLTRHCPETFMAPYATDTDVFGTREKRAEPGPVRKLLSVGQLIPRKGLREFATALGWWTQAHPDIGVEWKLAGDGPLRQEFLSLPHPPSLRVEHVGAVGYERLPELYSASDVLVLPSLADEWAVVVNEAMASGLPVLGSVCSQAVQELVEDGKTGWTFHPQRPPEMQEALDRALLAAPEKISAMGHAARQRAMRLSPAATADAIYAALLHAITRSGASAGMRHAVSCLDEVE